VVDLRQAAHHPMARQVPKRVEAEVAEAGVPQPGLVVAVHRQTHKSGDPEVDLVKAICGAVDLGEQMAILVANPEHVVIDEHLTAKLLRSLGM
jgi:hypothetical protein